MAERGRAWTRAAGVVLIVLVIDQITKALVRGSVDLGERKEVLGSVVRLVHIENRGVAFSFLEGRTGLVMVVIAVALVGLLVFFWRNAAMPGLWVPAGMLAGGALGNIVDRLTRDGVTDFVKLPAWPAFNVADMAITFGVIGLFVVVERAERRRAAADRA